MRDISKDPEFSTHHQYNLQLVISQQYLSSTLNQKSYFLVQILEFDNSEFCIVTNNVYKVFKTFELFKL